MTNPVHVNDWDTELLVIFYPERDRVKNRARFLQIDPEILAAARQENTNQARRTARHAIFLTIGLAFNVRPARIRWRQLQFIDPRELPREVDDD